MEAWTNGSTSAGNGVPRSVLAGTGEMTLTVMADSDRVSVFKLCRWIRRGTKPTIKPMMTSTMAMVTIPPSEAGAGGGVVGDGFWFMALTGDLPVSACSSGA